MTYFEFTKRFPDENSAIDFIVATKQLFNVLKKVCKPNTTVMTDQFSGYNILDKENDCNFVRLKVDHIIAFSLGNGIHTNGMESFWAILKRGVYGVYSTTYRSSTCRSM